MTLALTIQTPTDEEQKGGTIELPAEIFDVDANVSLLHQVVVAQLAAARQGTHATKTRGEVRGGGKKPYRQKGTGRARQGSNRAPQFAGGGVVHGPQPRNYEQRTPKKMKAAALRCALSDRARDERVFVVSSLVTGDTPSTKAAAATLTKVSGAKHVLVVAERTDELTWKSLRNVPTVHLLEPGQLNTYDVLVSDDVVFTQGALESFLAGPAKGKSANPDPTTSAGKSTDAAGTPGAGAASSAEVAEIAEQTIEADEDAEAAVAVSIEKPAKKAPAKKAAPKKVAPKQADAAEAVEASDEEDGN